MSAMENPITHNQAGVPQQDDLEQTVAIRNDVQNSNRTHRAPRASRSRSSSRSIPPVPSRGIRTRRTALKSTFI